MPSGGAARQARPIAVCTAPDTGEAALIEGLVESLTQAGVVKGWVRDTDRAAPCRVQITLGGFTLAEAMADEFRPDLLRAGHGHGHYGFSARLRRPLPRGAAQVAMHLPEQGVSAPMRVDVPELDPPLARTVESLLVEAPGWSTADLLERPACLDPAGNHARLGAAAFIDAVFRFVLARWPSKAEARMNADSLEHGRITPEGLLLDTLRSPERADMDRHLPSPFDPDFPFLPPVDTR